MRNLNRLETKPRNDIPDRLKVLLLLTSRIGIIKAQIANTAVELRKPEINSNSLAVPDVQIPVGLRGEPRDDVLLGALVVDLVQEADAEHLLRVDWLRGFVGGLGRGSARGRLWLLLVGFFSFFLFALLLLLLFLGFGGSGGAFREGLGVLGLWGCR